MINKIYIFGASGTGTTTLAKEVSKRFDYYHVDTDEILWLPTNPPFTKHRKREERKKILSEKLNSNKKCVISGSFSGWGDSFIPLLDLAIFLIVPTKIRIERIKERESRRYGKRILFGGDMYNTFNNFIEWAKTYDTASEEDRSKKMHENWIKLLRCPVERIEGNLSLEESIHIIKNILGE